jgi:hypothetical protein
VSVSRVKGDRGRCDVLFSRIVRSRGTCVRCGGIGTDTAHIVGRRYSATRCIEENAWCLCRGCHRLTGEDALDFMTLVDRTIGRERYMELRRMALAGIVGQTSLMFWRDTLARLLTRYDELGIADDWPKVPKTWRT